MVQCVLLLAAPPPATETASTTGVPPSNWTSFFAPSRMLEPWAILGSSAPGSLFASSTSGTDVVRMVILPFLATTVPAAWLPLADAPGVVGILSAAAPGVAPGVTPEAIPRELGLVVELLSGLLIASAPPAEAESAEP